MYDFYFDKTLFPVAPSKLQIKISNQNKTINLINEGEINALKRPGLTEITFALLLPSVPYPFAKYRRDRFTPASKYIETINDFKTRTDKDGKLIPFQLIISRWLQNKELFSTNLTVSLQDYKINEDSKNGYDVNVDVTLKQYKYYATKIINFEADGTASIDEQRQGAPKITSYTVGEGDHLWAIAAKVYGVGERYVEIYEANKSMIDEANANNDLSKYTVHKGMVLNITHG